MPPVGADEMGSHYSTVKRTLTSNRLLQEYLDWPHTWQVCKLERQVWDLALEPTHSEVAFGLTSCRVANAGPIRLLELTRGYEGIENG